MKIAIIIPTINEADQLESAIARAWESGPDEVIVADGGSTDGSSEIALNLNCKFVTSLPGRAEQMNTGADAATSDVLIFLHADNWLAIGACDQIRNALRSESVNFGGFEQSIGNDKRIFRWIESGNSWRAKHQGLIYGDQAFFIRKRVFESAGQFPSIELMEDFKLSQILKRRVAEFGVPTLLPGPTHVSARRWERSGAVRQTIRNWFLSFAFRLGASPKWLSKKYRRHDR